MMARYTHVTSGATVEVRDDKVMDSSWKKVGAKSSATRATASKTAASKSDKS